MNIPWDLIFELLSKMIEDCDDSPEGKVETVTTRPVAVFFGVTKALRQSNFSGRELRKARAEVLSEINSATPEELKAFVAGGPAALLALED